MVRAFGQADVVRHDRLQVTVGSKTKRGGKVDGVEGGHGWRGDSLRGGENRFLDGKESHPREELIRVL